MIIIRLLLIVFTAAFFALPAASQLFLPEELQQAYSRDTRNIDGYPGSHYFQNHASYDIAVDFDPVSGSLAGKADITYYNESPDTLRRLVFRNYMNIFREGVARDFSIGNTDLHNGVEISEVAFNDIPLQNPEDKINQRSTVMTIALPEPLPPKGNTKVSLAWAFTMPMDISIRMGRYGEDNWMVAYWYPQIAVYDDISGWDMHPFTGSAEFYNDFNDFRVEIKVPEGYMVWATGLLQDEEKHFNGTTLRRLEKSRRSGEVVPIISAKELEQGDFLKAEEPWTYVAESVPDFAFAVSRSYLWDATSVEVEHGRRVWVDAAYKPDSKDFHKVAALSAEIIHLFSEEVIGEAFPYPQMTAFNGGGGMEFPMMINDGDASTHKGTVYLTAHEIGHTYFPFHVMTNESFYAFMDEGLVSFIPRLVEGILLEDPHPMKNIVQDYAAQAATMRQVPLMVPSDMISDYAAYRVHSYTRPANAFFILQQMLGADLFKEAMLEYIQRWKKKHPTPYDFFNTIEDVTGKELEWFWEPWFFDFGYPDLAIGQVEHTDDQLTIAIKKKGALPVPETIDHSAAVWSDEDRFVVTLKTEREVSLVLLGGINIPDSRPEDNVHAQQKE